MSASARTVPAAAPAPISPQARAHPRAPAADGPGTPAGAPPGRASPAAGLGRALAALDARADAASSRLRGHPAADRLAGALSVASDYGAVWVLLAAVKARRPGPRRRRAVAALGLAGTVSYGVNRAVKRAVGRQRPGGAGAVGSLPVRAPTSSSFPSGHTLAAFCASVSLPESGPGIAAAVTFAAAVAASRVHLRAHHASDVLGGAVIGCAAGLAVRRLTRAATGR